MVGSSPDVPIAPRFSIVIPTFQRRDVVCQTLQAVDRLVFDQPFETLVVIDGSTDGTAEAIAGLGLCRPPIVIEQPNRGLAEARNRGALEASGEILLFLDDDMECHPDLLQHHDREFVDGADLTIGALGFTADSPDSAARDVTADWLAERHARLSRDGIRSFDDILFGQAAIRRELFEQRGGFDTRFTASGTYGNEDLDLGYRLIGKCDIRYVANAISNQRYVVTVAQHFRQFGQLRSADMAMLAKYREIAGGRSPFHDPDSIRARALFRPLGGNNITSYAILGIANWLCTRFYGQNSLVDRALKRIFHFAREVAYWSDF